MHATIRLSIDFLGEQNHGGLSKNVCHPLRSGGRCPDGAGAGQQRGLHRAPSPAGAGARGGDLSGDQYVRGTARRYEPDRAAARCSGCLGAIEKTGSRLLATPDKEFFM